MARPDAGEVYVLIGDGNYLMGASGETGDGEAGAAEAHRDRRGEPRLPVHPRARSARGPDAASAWSSESAPRTGPG